MTAQWSKYHCYKQALSHYDLRCMNAKLRLNKKHSNWARLKPCKWCNEIQNGKSQHIIVLLKYVWCNISSSNSNVYNTIQYKHSKTQNNYKIITSIIPILKKLSDLCDKGDFVILNIKIFLSKISFDCCYNIVLQLCIELLHIFKKIKYILSGFQIKIISYDRIILWSS